MKFFNLLLVMVMIGMGWAPSGSYAADMKTPAMLSPETAQTEINITADQLLVDSQAKFAEFSGNVKAVQGETVITARRLRIFYQQNSQSTTTSSTKGSPPMQSISKIVAQGNVVIKFDNRVAKSEQAVYTTNNKVLVLSGENSELLSGPNVIRGNKIILNRVDGNAVFEGSDKGQVKFLYHPEGDGLN